MDNDENTWYTLIPLTIMSDPSQAVQWFTLGEYKNLILDVRNNRQDIKTY
jgi:hypothetical protein